MKAIKPNDFDAYREAMNKKLLTAPNNKIIKRIFNVDTNTYRPGALDEKTKEMMGLVASMVLKCDDCIYYHLERCFDKGVQTEELMEIFGVANLVGGTIIIPHTRRAMEFWGYLKENGENKKG